MQYFDGLIPISYLRQYRFCSRIPWYKTIMQFEPPEQAWVKQGKQWHSTQTQLHKKRLIKELAPPLKRKTNYYVRENSLGLHGYIDEISFNAKEGIVIEYKSDTQAPNKGQKLQLAAYAMAAEAYLGINIQQGVLLKGSGYKQFKLVISNTLKLEVIETTKKVRASMGKTSMPNSSAQAAQCIQCEYLRYCNDR
ncbi:MAG: CRISPR-associated protein Cas4 [Paraglaciecola sp.]|uniref:CRISPR-associated protein Cas4 n=1 Tax=Paraglaciecola sp. TaxID=1920173 RepID=UPI003299DFD7